MQPSVQKYLTTIYIHRGETEAERNMINPPEAFLLAALYINGFGVDKDTSKALLWLSRASRTGYPLAQAYGYRIVRGLGVSFEDPGNALGVLTTEALRGSRAALNDLSKVSKEAFEATKSNLRLCFGGTGARFFHHSEMLHGFTLGMWLKTFGNVPVLLENFSRLNRIADYKVNNRGDRILHIAASCGQVEAIEALLDRFPILEVNQVNDQGETPLLFACRAGQTRTVLWLASHEAKASITAQNGESSLHWLISFDDEDIESVGSALVQAGADTGAKTMTSVAHGDFPSSMVPDRLPEGYPISWGECFIRHVHSPGLFGRSVAPVLTISSFSL